MQLARDLPSPDAEALLGLAEEIAHDALAPAAAVAEETATFPSEAFSLLGQTGLLWLIRRRMGEVSNRMPSISRCSRSLHMHG